MLTEVLEVSVMDEQPISIISYNIDNKRWWQDWNHDILYNILQSIKSMIEIDEHLRCCSGTVVCCWFCFPTNGPSAEQSNSWITIELKNQAWCIYRDYNGTYRLEKFYKMLNPMIKII